MLYRKPGDSETVAKNTYDQLVGVIADVDEKFCNRWVRPIDLESPPPLPALAEGAVLINEKPMSELFWMGINCAKDKTGKLYYFTEVAGRWQSEGTEWQPLSPAVSYIGER